jgi:hypothetical protein
LMSSINNDSLGINPLFVKMCTPHSKGWGKDGIISLISKFNFPVIYDGVSRKLPMLGF